MILRTEHKIYGLVLSLFLSGCNLTQEVSETAELNNVSAQVININKGWQFTKSEQDIKFDTLPTQSWDDVDLPHTPKIEPMVVNDQWQGFSWYKKEIDIPKHWQKKKLIIRFEGAMNAANLWVNGENIASHLGGYLPFVADITDHVEYGKTNHIFVKLDNRDNYITGPKPLELLDFNTYGGLYRGATLHVKNSVFITDEILADEIASGGIFVSYPEITNDKAIVAIQTHIENSEFSAQTIDVVQNLMFEGQLVESTTQTITLDANSQKTVKQTVSVINPKLWHPNNPNLYSLETEIKNQQHSLEKQQTRIGIRSFAFNDKHELLINGEKIFLRGVNRHQEYPHVGYALSPQADYRDAVKIKSAGFDYVRLSHYPHSKDFIKAADELGLVLVDAILGWQYFSPFPEFQEQIVQTCRDMIRRDRNHASIMAWECSLNESWMPPYFTKKLNDAVHSEYPGSYSAGWQTDFDIFFQARQHRLQHYDEPSQPYNVSEYGDWEYYAQNAGLSQDSWADLKSEERTSRQLLSHGEKRLLQQARNIQEAHNDNLKYPAHADGYWVMFDYNRGYADDLESSGVMSLFRLPKYSYYFYQSQRAPEIRSTDYQSGPMVFIASEWTEQSSIPVRVYSNAEEVELWLNGRLVSRNKPTINKLSDELSHPPFEFDLNKFIAGELVAKAYINGVQVAEHTVKTPKTVTQVNLRLDKSGVAPTAGVKDIVFIYAQLKDDAGTTVPLNHEKVVFEVSGDIQFIESTSRTTEQGIAAGLLQMGNDLTDAKIRVSYPAKNITSKWVRILDL
ncbi:glycoside hydrolase family 2 protein [Catenovulum sediminis]|uniref:Sugar-binding domain-containing protein n=1 Tax=Catenovulum sediminis TaxID=1740262 RepID=A0ABV1RJI6_9ALTE